jgi:hypothetical protein
LEGCDCVVNATGNETAGLAIDELLRGRGPRVHVWLEPLGLAQHVLQAPPAGHPGCFRCLFDRDGELELTNKAALAAPGQEFEENLAGCGGAYVPFSCLDASRAATEAVQAVVDSLSGDSGPLLLTRAGDPARFVEGGYRLSARAERFHGCTIERRSDIARVDCPICGSEL